MTICIVAMSFMEGVIITVSDRSLSYNDHVPASDNAALKAFAVAPKWGALFSGDIGPVPEIIQDVRSQLYAKHGKVTVELVQEAFRKAWHKSATQRIVDRHLLRLGYKTLEEFNAHGLKNLGPEEFSRMNTKIEAFDPGLQFLVYGFDEDPVERSHIFVVDTPGGAHDDLITNCDIQGFGVIGSGFWAALGVLTSRSVGTLHDADEMAYALLEAKFAAESSSGVGRATTLMGISKTGRTAQLTPADIDAIRAEWEYARKDWVPNDAGILLVKKLKKR